LQAADHPVTDQPIVLLALLGRQRAKTLRALERDAKPADPEVKGI